MNAVEVLAGRRLVAEDLATVIRLSSEREDLMARQRAAEELLAMIVGINYKSGELTDADLCEIYLRFREAALPGYSKVWDAHVPRTTQWISNAVRYHACDNHWTGYAGNTSTAPPKGIIVAYVLYGENEDAVYAGTTFQLRQRLRDHVKEGKAFRYWYAQRCRDRAHARQVRRQLIGDAPCPNETTGGQR